MWPFPDIRFREQLALFLLAVGLIAYGVFRFLQWAYWRQVEPNTEITETMVILTEEELRRNVVAALRFGIDAHARGSYKEIAPLFDQLAVLQSRVPGRDPDIRVAIDFLDSWYDSANHGWAFYEPMGREDWPHVAAQLATDLESNRSIDRDVRKQFTF